MISANNMKNRRIQQQQNTTASRNKGQYRQLHNEVPCGSVSHILLLLLGLLKTTTDELMTVYAQQQEEELQSNNNCSTISEIACGDAYGTEFGFNILCEALELTGLVDDFDTDLWTLFAPTDDAFRQLAPGQVSGLANDLNALTQLMLFHAAPGVSLNTTELICDDRLEMANGEDSFTTCFTGEDGAIVKGQAGDDNLEVDTAVIPRIMSSIDSCNGQINVIDSLMLFGGFSIMMDTVQNQTPEPSSTTTLLPSDMPSLVPSTKPSLFPSDIPSMAPSTSPSDLPSDIPSMVPSTSPSKILSDIPSMIPSTQPTDDISLPLPSTSDGSGEYDPCTIIGVACSLEDFSTLCAALKATGFDKSLDTVTEEPTTIFTVFAPTNAAFQELGAATLKFLLEINTDLLAEILLFHVVADKALPIDALECSGLVKMAHGTDSRTVCRGDYIYQKGGGNDPAPFAPEIIASDVDTCNGIIHVVDRVMFWTEPEELGLPPPTKTTPAPTETETLSTEPTLAPTIGDTLEPSSSPSTEIRTIDPSSSPTSDILTIDPSSSPTTNPSSSPSSPTPTVPTTMTDAPTSEAAMETNSPTLPAKECQTVTELACSNVLFTILCEAITRTGLTDALGSGEWTVFAPTNEAFEKSFSSSDAAKLSEDTDLLREILLYHTIEDQVVPEADLPCVEGENLITMTNGKDVRSLCKLREPTWLKGAGNICKERDRIITSRTERWCTASPHIISTDVEVCNGIVHVLDGVLLFDQI